MGCRQTNISDMVFVALGAVLIAVCSWISIPFTVPFTMQTFAVFLVSGLYGMGRGTMSLVIYLLLGCVGMPVFTGFRGGLHVLAGPTGGYLVGFLCLPPLMGAMQKMFGKKNWVFVVSGCVGLLLCYAFGTAWFMILYMYQGENIGIMAVLGMCVFPFVIPDILKLGLAMAVVKRFKRMLP